MLLLLTLALLGSPACWADQTSEMYGSNKGTFFCTSEHSGEAVKGIRVFTNILGMILNFQVKFGDSWDEAQGVPGGKAQEFELGTDEYFTEIHGSFLLNLKHLILCTNRGRCASFGKRLGQEFSSLPKEEDQVLTGICGMSGLIGIRGIAPKWGYIPLNSTPETNAEDFGYPD